MERRRALSVLAGLGAWALAGCATRGDAMPPRIRLADLRFLDGGLFAQQVGLDLLVGNPNDFDVPLEGLTFELEVNGQAFADGYSNRSVTLPRLSEVRVPVTGSTTLLSLVQQALTLGERSDLTYKLSGVAHLGGLKGRKVPYEQKGKLRLLPERDTGGVETLVPL